MFIVYTINDENIDVKVDYMELNELSELTVQLQELDDKFENNKQLYAALANGIIRKGYKKIQQDYQKKYERSSGASRGYFKNIINLLGRWEKKYAK